MKFIHQILIIFIAALLPWELDAQGIGGGQLPGLGSNGVSGSTNLNIAPSPPNPYAPSITSVSGIITGSQNAYGGTGGTGLSAYGPGTVTIYWQTNQASTSIVHYGTTSAYGFTASNSSLVTSHFVTLTGLAADTDYHYSVQSQSYAGLSAGTPDAIFTSEGVTLGSLKYPGGHIGFAAENQFTSNYVKSVMPADAILQAEVTSITSPNDCKWRFTANSDGSVNQFAGSGCQAYNTLRFPTLGHQMESLLWTADFPSAMVIDSGNWQSEINFRVTGAGGFAPTFNNGADFWAIEACNECLTSVGPLPALGGPSYWTAPFTDLVTASPPNYLTSKLLLNQYELGENWLNWGGDAGPGAPWLAQPNNKVISDFGIDQMQQYIIAGGRIDAVGIEGHFGPIYMISENDLKYVLWDYHRLGVIPEVTEFNIAQNAVFGFGTGSPELQAYDASYISRILYNLITVGGVIDISFWNGTANCCGTFPWLSLWNNNQKTPLYYALRNMLSVATPATSFPVVRRFGLYNNVPPPVTTSNSPITCEATLTPCGTQGLLTIPWTQYVYRTNNGDGTYGAVTNFSQDKWTMVLQFFTLGDSGGNLFEAQDSSNNPLVTVNRTSGTGVTTVTIGGGSPVTVGTAAADSYLALVITKNGTGWQFSLGGDTVTTTTGSIASIANLLWLDNSGSALTDAVLCTIDVYEAQSAITGGPAIQAASVFQNSNVLTFAQINGWTPP